MIVQLIEPLGTAALGWPAERSSASSSTEEYRASLDWTAGGGCPHVVRLRGRRATLNFCYAGNVLRMHKSAWLLALLSAGLQISVFPLPNLYFLGWVAIAPLLIALLRAREPDTLQLRAGIKLLPAKPGQAFLLAYALRHSLVCRNLLLDLQHHAPVRRRGHARRLRAAGSFLLVSRASITASFGLLISLLASPRDGDGTNPFEPPGPCFWRRSSGLRWNWRAPASPDFPGTCWASARWITFRSPTLPRVTGVYGLSFEIMVVNTALAAAFAIRAERGQRSKRKPLLLAASRRCRGAASRALISPPALPTDHTARLVQQNIPVLQGGEWTKEYFEGTLRDLSLISLSPAELSGQSS